MQYLFSEKVVYHFKNDNKFFKINHDIKVIINNQYVILILSLLCFKHRLLLLLCFEKSV